MVLFIPEAPHPYSPSLLFTLTLTLIHPHSCSPSLSPLFTLTLIHPHSHPCSPSPSSTLTLTLVHPHPPSLLPSSCRKHRNNKHYPYERSSSIISCIYNVFVPGVHLYTQDVQTFRITSLCYCASELKSNNTCMFVVHF